MDSYSWLCWAIFQTFHKWKVSAWYFLGGDGKAGNLQKDLDKLQTFIELLSQGQRLPADKFKELKGREKKDIYKDFEIKAGRLRVYLFEDITARKIIVLGELKKDEKRQSRKIEEMRAIKLEYFGSKDNWIMKSHSELLQTETYWTTKIQIDLYNAVEIYLKEQQMTRSEFAKKLGVTKSYVTQILKGDFDHRLSKLVEIALLIGKVPILKFEDFDSYSPETKLEKNEASNVTKALEAASSASH